MNLTAQTVMALMMPSVFLAQCFFHQPLLLYIVQTLAEVGLTVLPPFRQSDQLCVQVNAGRFQRI